ncbi:putative transcriptional regulatory protein pro-1 [Podospora conica]|nr:putative transcriptional regulatory protein pro-1 [Schizothecium conicum]
MSTPPPNHHGDHMKSSQVNVNMAAAAAAKTKPASKAGAATPNATITNKQKSQMHRRSRTGCYTCRLRRKKCDEGTPMCTACKHLGLQCEYKRPMWWSNNDARRQKKEDIKMIIKRKKLSEKSSHTHIHTNMNSPPGLSHSLPTSATFSDPLDRTRSASIDSHFPFTFNSPQSHHDFTPFTTPQLAGDFMFPPFSPYGIDVKTERHVFIDDMPALRESTTSTFSTYQAPPPPGSILPSFPLEGEWTEQVYSERRESHTEETLNVNFFDYPQGPTLDTRQVAVELDEGDQRLLEHFVREVLPILFPILESNNQGFVSSDLILPALQNNKGYLHCCLSIAAQHFKAVSGTQGEDIDGDIMRHRYAVISSLCDALNRDENHHQILETTLSLIFFQCSVGRFDDALPDIPWHQHFQAAISLVQKLDLPRIVSEPTETPQPAPFNMTLSSWIDILGATMLGRAPVFAHTYREKHLSHNPSLGLRELMGCEDRVMYLISEIACLEALKKDGMNDITLCHHVRVLGDQIGLTEAADDTVILPFNSDGSLCPKQLSKNVTAAFRLAARIYLCNLVPGFHPSQSSCVGLVEKLTAVLQQIPSGRIGFDRSLCWVYLVGGAVSTAGSSFRTFFEDRVAQLGEQSHFGSFGRVASLLREVWLQTDLQQATSPASATSESSSAATALPYIHWRDVMQLKGWDYLLI